MKEGAAMLSDLVDLCRKAAASIQSIVAKEVSAEQGRGTQSGRQANIHGSQRARTSARRWALETSEYRSDFAGEAPDALVNAYREATEGDGGEHLSRRSFVI
ncbi:hypothetical protein SAZ10_23435 [Mesorhizobium sp. BAC0120]|uniref:hypothetical protein n=1 Tax=Mesorhizobium sp. BAC0120 TaxID=3090670 RepID=UPI00298CA958|nr:hypothetical protein [Mesorhizobium sp. BAC0120]MDW6024713.1 hypothetical protein [Mesorhizobium sp. BAC0120]